MVVKVFYGYYFLIMLQNFCHLISVVRFGLTLKQQVGRFVISLLTSYIQRRGPSLVSAGHTRVKVMLELVRPQVDTTYSKSPRVLWSLSLSLSLCLSLSLSLSLTLSHGHYG